MQSKLGFGLSYCTNNCFLLLQVNWLTVPSFNVQM